MIQRIQTVYLFLGALAMGALFLFSELWASAPAEQFGWFTPITMLLAAVTALGGLGAIVLYANRARQRTVAAALQMLAALTTVFFFVSFFSAGALGLQSASGTVDIGKIGFLALPIVAYVLFMLARRAIQSDINLVRSMDRLR